MERLLFSNHCLTVTRLLFIALVFSANIKLHGEETKAPSFSGDKIQQVRNILSDKCFSCHGPDEKKRKGKLRLDSKTDAYAIRDDGFPILPGKPQESLIYARMTSSEKDEVMPPPNSGKSLNPQEKELMRDWISAGAPWADHWSFIAPVKPQIPTVKNPNQIRNPIDSFIQKRLEVDGLEPNEVANRATRVRRLYLDLTGIPSCRTTRLTLTRNW